MPELRRDRITWISYLLLAWFAYLQATPGLVVAHLRHELRLGYSAGGLHVAAFAAGAAASGLISARLDRTLGRRTLLWSSAGLMGAGTVALTAGRLVEMTVGAVLVMGIGGGLLLATIQATLADHHGEHRTIALAEANVAASIAYVVLIGALSLTAALHLGWRVALWVSIAIPLGVWWQARRLVIDAPPTSHGTREHLPGPFWIAATMLLCMTAAEWCVTAWGATFVQEAAGVSTDTAVLLMAGYFGGVLAGRTLGSRLAHRFDPTPLIASALVTAAVGFVTLWSASAPGQAVVGLALLGIGLGNLFPMGLSVAIELAPDRAARASGRAVTAASLAVLLAPLMAGMLADATSLKAALTVVPVALALAAVALALVHRAAGRRPSWRSSGCRVG